MFEQILAKFHDYEVAYRDEVIETRRRFLRHQGLSAEVMVQGRPYALLDWSQGGVLFETPLAETGPGVYYDSNPVRKLGIDEVVPLTLRFHILGRTMEISLEGRITRSDYRGTVAAFDALTPAQRRQFAKLTDLYNARDFLESQTGRPHNDNDYFG